MKRMTELIAGRKNRKGFTLIELIVVIAILGILAVVIVPRFANFTKNAQHNSVLSDAKSAQKAIATFYAQNGSYPDASDLTPNYLSGTAAAHVLTLSTGGTLTLGVTATVLDGTFTYVKTINGTAYTATCTDSAGAITVSP